MLSSGSLGPLGTQREALALLWALGSTWWTGVQLTPEEWREFSRPRVWMEGQHVQRSRPPS